MSKRMQKLYVGDVGIIVDMSTQINTSIIPSDEELDKLSLRELCNIAIQAGISVRDIIGVNHCWEHRDMVLLNDREMPMGFNLFDHCKYCKNCFQLFRLKSLR